MPQRSSAVLSFGRKHGKHWPVNRRAFIALIGAAAAARPLAARAQQRAMPVVGFLHAGSPTPMAPYLAAFLRALAEAGYIENKNVAIEYRYAEGQYDRLPLLAADLIRQQVAVIVAGPNEDAARAAIAASSGTPIVFNVTGDPVKFGLVASLSRPGGNATGVNSFMSELVAKRLGLLRELLPSAARFGALVNPNAATAEDFVKDFATAASTLGVQFEIAHARDSREIEIAFATLVRNKTDALMVAPDTFFASRNVQIVTLGTRHAFPAIYTVRAYVEHGGLMSYGPSVADAYRQLAVYTARILRGEKPADLPVVQSTKLDLVINLPTARALGLDVPPMLLARADEVIE
jgi:putative ABC transport system substrate-binding protein